MKPKLLVASILIATLSLAVIAFGCGDDDDSNGDEPSATNGDATAAETDNGGATPAEGATTLDFEVAEFDIVGPADAASGAATFNVTNNGAIAHSFVVVKTDIGAEELPVSGDTVDESGLDIVGQLLEPDLPPEGSAELEVELEPGAYVLLCNVPTHYAAGMAAGFTVE